MAEKPPGESAKEHLKVGLGHMWRAAREAARFVQQEAGGLRRDASRRSVTRTIDDAGREVARAANNVADRIGDEISHLEQSARRMLGDEPPPGGPPGAPADEARPRAGRPEGMRGDPSDVPRPTHAEDWPKTREEYELRYGPPSEPGAARPTERGPRDAGLRIASDDDDR